MLLAVAGSASLLAEAVGREVTISDSDIEKFLPAVAYNGDRQEFLVVWHNLSGTGVRDISAARLDRFGKVISTFIVASGAYSRAQPAVAYDDVRDRYLVVYIYDYLRRRQRLGRPRPAHPVVRAGRLADRIHHLRRQRRRSGTRRWRTRTATTSS